MNVSDLEAERIDVTATGGADVTVRATGEVKGEASGGARVSILGDPEWVDVATSGGASVNEG